MIVTKETWDKAQLLERQYHNLSLPDGLLTYGNGYRGQLFKYVGIDYKDMKGVSILEIGCADFPALFFCNNVGASYVIEPMPSRILDRLSYISHFIVIKSAAEKVDFPSVDEVWLFNVLTHVIGPDIIVDKAKERAKIIRFFEPINTAISEDHPWSFDIEYYTDRFGDCVKHYPTNPDAVNFHEHECCYGVWRKDDGI